MSYLKLLVYVFAAMNIGVLVGVITKLMIYYFQDKSANFDWSLIVVCEIGGIIISILPALILALIFFYLLKSIQAGWAFNGLMVFNVIIGFLLGYLVARILYVGMGI
jgi:sterol desaturase/sphingolipid hydroxylase (fatty acid hydroxylase superfamily)